MNLSRKLWIKLVLRGLHYSDRHAKLNALYRIRDPWGMETDRERFRFDQTNRLIRENIGAVESILEVGCGEGHQSAVLATTCDRLLGIDVSDRAVRRARERCPYATFDTGDVYTAPAVRESTRFDLVTACEIIYYMQDVPAAIARLSELGKWCFVTYYDDRGRELDEPFGAIPGVRQDTFRHGETIWKAVWWQNE